MGLWWFSWQVSGEEYLTCLTKKKKNVKKPVLSTNYPPDLPQFFKNCMIIKLHLVKKKSINFSFKIPDNMAQRNQLRLPNVG